MRFGLAFTVDGLAGTDQRPCRLSGDRRHQLQRQVPQRREADGCQHLGIGLGLDPHAGHGENATPVSTVCPAETEGRARRPRRQRAAGRPGRAGSAHRGATVAPPCTATRRPLSPLSFRRPRSVAEVVGMGRRGRSGGMSHQVASEVGAYGERLAARYLAEAGLEVLERNWRCAQGEIDIVARDGDCLVVCEVKTRRALVVRRPGRGGDLAQGGAVAAARGVLAGRAPRAGERRWPTCGSTWSGCCGRGRARHSWSTSWRWGREAGAHPVGRAGRAGGCLGRRRGRPGAGAAAVPDQRSAGRGVQAVPGPDQGRRGRTRGAGAQPAVDGQPVAGVDAQGRQRLRPADRDRRARRGGPAAGGARGADGAHRRAGPGRVGAAGARGAAGRAGRGPARA